MGSLDLERDLEEMLRGAVLEGLRRDGEGEGARFGVPFPPWSKFARRGEGGRGVNLPS